MFSRFSPSGGDVLHVASRNMCFSAHGSHDWSQRPFGQFFSRMTRSQSSHTAVLQTASILFFYSSTLTLSPSSSSSFLLTVPSVSQPPTFSIHLPPFIFPSRLQIEPLFLHPSFLSPLLFSPVIDCVTRSCGYSSCTDRLTLSITPLTRQPL